MRSVLHHVAPVQHQPAPLLRNRGAVPAHPPEDAFDAADPEYRDRECVMPAVTHFGRRATR